jgi:predicted RNA binding protein YcfA (HicA-like mRNA interferase family)
MGDASFLIVELVASAFLVAMMLSLPMKYRDIIKIIEADGWVLARTKGSHMQYRHPSKPGTVTISAGGKLSKDVPIGTLQSIRRQAGLK